MRNKCLLLAALLLLPGVVRPEKPRITLQEWQRGIAVESSAAAGMSMYLWFYEWTLFDAVRPGEHTPGFYDFYRELGRDHSWAVIRSSIFELTAVTTEDGADLSLHVTNLTDHDWPEIAAIIPCFNPGREEEGSAESRIPKNRQFADIDQKHTYFLGPDGLTPLVTRAIHFNDRLRAKVDMRSKTGQFVFSSKWPTSPVNANGGLIVRESSDGQWVTGISWDQFVSVQAHNPWHCMHHSVRVGPLKKNESKVIPGRIYLFRGTKEDVLTKYRKTHPQHTRTHP
jgi:hypothetical protein